LFEATAEVSSSAQNADWAGTGSQLEHQEMKRGLEIKRDIERSFIGIYMAAAIGTVGSTARKLGSLSALCSTATKFGNAAGGAAAAGYGAVAIDRDGTDTRALTEAMVLGAHQAMYKLGADPNWLLVSPVDAAKVANFAYVAPVAGAQYAESSRGRMVGEGVLYNKVETYISPYGTMSVVTDRFVSGSGGTIEDDGAPAAGDGYVFLVDTDAIFVPTLFGLQSEALAKVGHADRRLISTELTLGLDNSNSAGVIGDLTIV
jgi:hypothetical protein